MEDPSLAYLSNAFPLESIHPPEFAEFAEFAPKSLVQGKGKLSSVGSSGVYGWGTCERREKGSGGSGRGQRAGKKEGARWNGGILHFKKYWYQKIYISWI